MTNIKDEKWKKELRSKLITGMIGDLQERKVALEEVGYYYMCYAPAFLYKYYSDNPLKVDLLKEQRMWYSAPCNFNDVFDCDISVSEADIFNSALQIIPDKREVRKGSPMWRQLKQVINKEIRSLRDTFENMKRTAGISCLSESYESMLMWAHYANNHSGMCVEYELMKINEQLGFSPVPVIYNNERVKFSSINQDRIESDMVKVFVESLTSKSFEWSYEKEWRIIRDEDACGDRWDIQKKGALLDMIRPRSIILGCMVKPEFEKIVREYCQEYRVNLYKMEKDLYLYRLKKSPVLQFEAQEEC
ncbi:MAG: DUF2971 domain-containing protein [Bacillota bacterium]|nr:DUF2971 domain-containing protein [Bacillota bacterium]